MTHVADLSPCNFFPFDAGETLLAVGWLERAKPFPTGATPPDVYARLRELIVNPWQPFVSAGVHECALCQFHGEAQGSDNLFIPDGRVIYVCPALIAHYINAHHYRPPEEFCRAVLKCPDTRSMEYKRLLLASGGRALVRQVSRRPDRGEF
jgi:hypothetical protein